MRPLLSIVLVFIFIVFTASSVKDDSLPDILEKLQKFRTAYPQEKVHLHIDKPYYTIGDTVWVKAYLVNSENNHPSSLSNVLYIDLINENDSIKRQIILPVENGTGWGNLTLDGDLLEGSYRLRGYSKWMRNFNEDFLFNQSLYIGNAISNSVLVLPKFEMVLNGDIQEISSEILFVDSKGVPLVDKKIDYDIRLKDGKRRKGKETTDMDGRLSFTFSTEAGIDASDYILTTIKLDNNASIDKVVKLNQIVGSVDFQFFPEGGNLVENIASKVAFKASGSDGRGISLSGSVLDQDKNVITSFKSEHVGMGSFVFTPGSGRRYHAVINFSNGFSKEVDLPAPQASGYVMTVDNNNAEFINLVVECSQALAGSTVSIVAHSQGVVGFSSSGQLAGGKISLKIPKRGFRSGIASITLFTVDDQPVAERLVFINHNDFLNINVATGALSYSRDKVRVNVRVTDASGRPVAGNFSMSVIDREKIAVDENRETSILSNLLLSSDLKGIVEEPNFYFSANDPDRFKYLDNLMLSQGWRRFAWNEILEGTFPELKFKQEKSLSVKGRLVRGGSPARNMNLSMYPVRNPSQRISTSTDLYGYFSFEGLGFPDSTIFIIQPENLNATIELEVQEVLATPVEISAQTMDGEELMNYLVTSRALFEEIQRYDLDRTIILDEVTIQGQSALSRASNPSAGMASYTINSEKLKTCPTVLECLPRYIPGLRVQGDQLILNQYRNMSFGGGGGGTNYAMTVKLNGSYMASTSALSSVNIDEIYAIEVVSGNNANIYGLNAAGGILVVTTKAEAGITPEDNSVSSLRASLDGSFRPKGYNVSREFYSPLYGGAGSLRGADLRSTIFWKPYIQTDSTGTATIEYFNADAPGDYRIVVEGLSDSGQLGRSVSTYEVR